MVFHLLIEYWWAVLLALVVFFLGFGFVVTRRERDASAGDRARIAWSRWRAISAKAANFQARVILTVFYFTLAAPFGIARTFLSDTLRVRSGAQEGWIARTTRDRTLADARKQY